MLDHFNQYKDAAVKKEEQAHKLLEYMKKGLAGGAADISDYFAITSYQVTAQPDQRTQSKQQSCLTVQSSQDIMAWVLVAEASHGRNRIISMTR